MTLPLIKTALISVSDKTGIAAFCVELAGMGVKIISTGGTAKLLAECNVSVTDVSEHTGFEEIMDGRVKTLHPKIHGGILARRGRDDAIMAANGITPIDLVVVNLYPFEQTVATPECDLATAIENIDIGGPAMLRAAAKNHAYVTVVVDRQDYGVVLTSMQQQGAVDAETRYQLATKTYAHTAHYDAAVANYLARLQAGQSERQPLPQIWSAQFHKRQDMRYGENPHQSAAFYVDSNGDPSVANVANASQLQGKALSYNNIVDTDTALACVRQFDSETPACVIVKHANPCGVAVAASQLTAYQRAFSTDPESAFGGIIAFNQQLDEQTATAITCGQFVEVIIAPAIAAAARQLLAAKPDVRLLECGALNRAAAALDHVHDYAHDYKRVGGGWLIQSADIALYHKLQVVTERPPTDAEMADLLFAMKVAKFVKSNAIIYANALMTIGVGAGQMSRVNAARIATIKAAHAGLSVAGAVLASDAFFPFRDGLEQAAENGIAAVIQPGGSVRDNEVIAAANQHNIAMLFTGMRHFRH